MYFDYIPNEITKRLWEHQRQALDFAVEHLNKLESPCLIRMPTGTGKTGLIACLSRYSNKGSTLVLTPWAHLRKQMVTDIETDFWKRINVTPKDIPTTAMFPSVAKKIVAVKDPQIIVSTFATLNALRLNEIDIYKALGKALSLVVVDEGHYEPALEWGKSVKGLKVKTLLLTATPYRNDLKLFRITNAQRSTHHFTHKEAVHKKIIRKLSFENLDATLDIPSLSTAFAKKWSQVKKSKRLPSPTPRAIVCCSEASQVEESVACLRKAGVNAIGVHEAFESSIRPYLLMQVPDPQTHDAEVWVHQHKLTEGLNDHRFCCAAFFTRIRNDRKLVQQIGRILRRDDKDRDSAAIVFAPREYSAESEWDSYLHFETELKLLEPQHFRDVVQTLLNAQPKVEYFEGRFRRRFDPAELTKQSQVIIPPSVLVRKVGHDFSIDDYAQDSTDTLNTNDAVILGPNINEPCQKAPSFALWVYASVRNSRFLQNTSLYEVRLETHCVVVAGGFVFMTDSRGNFPEGYLEEHTANVPAAQLARYFDKNFRPTHVSVDSSIPYDNVLRGAELRGHNLLSIPVSLTDRVHICRAVRGSSRDFGRRYVGMNNGRLRKELAGEERRAFDLKTFVSWAQGVANILNSKVAESVLFQRYMPVSIPPSNPIPKILCLDLVRLDLSLTAEGDECRLRNSSSDIQQVVNGNDNLNTCSFDFEVDGGDVLSVSLTLEYHSEKQRFWFNKQKGATVRVHQEEEEEPSTKSLVEFLNQRQDLVLIGLDHGELVYQGRNFYKIDYTYAEEVLLDLIERPSGSPTCKTEKGSKEQIAELKLAHRTKFPPASLFRAIADRHINLPFNDDILICADLGTECADFLAANFAGRQLALIHAKVGDGEKISAKAFHDVVAQAMKNLVYLTRNAEVPKGVASWKRDSKWNGTNIPRLYRTQSGVPVQKQLWSKVKSEIIESSNPQLFVVIVTAGCCELHTLKQAVVNPAKRTPEVAQLLHLLDGLNGHARQLGVRLILRDLPYGKD